MHLQDDGSGWAVWQAYLRGKERILARPVDTGSARLGPVVELNDRPGIVHSPQLAAGPFGWCAVWSEKVAGRWRIMTRLWRSGQWGPAEPISPLEIDALQPSVLATAAGQLVVAWSGYPAAGRGESSIARVQARLWNGRAWQAPVEVSDGRHPAYRPALVEDAGQVWAVWDEYLGLDSVIQARPIMPQPGPIEQVSQPQPPGRRCLLPVAVGGSRLGMGVAWLVLTDIIGGEGVIDQLHTLQVAVRRGGRWQRLRDGDDDNVAYLVSGLLTDIRAGRGYPSGYLGRRRHPLLLADGDSIWLFWEHKPVQRGRGPETPGQLLGRCHRSGRWGPTVRLHAGLLDYRLVQPARLRRGRLWLVGSELPRHWTRPYRWVAVDPGSAQPAEPERWDDQFRPVRLPLEAESPRHQITVDGQRYQLYWADMHCHSGMTPDAEGEPDEILYYGRDRARLDVMMLQDNDEIYNCFLTESQYQLAVLHSQRISRPGRFVALPAYEWTQRTVDAGTPFDPFAPVYGQANTFPNHRTVIYPMRGGPIVRYPEVGGNFSYLCDVVERAGGVMFTQHHVFVPTRRACETNMEVATGWGIYLHRARDHFHRVLNDGYRLGFVACGDSHRRNPGLCGGLTGIYASQLTADAIIDALRHRRCYATNGSKIVVEARANGRLFGEAIEAPGGSVRLELLAVGTRPIASATLVRDGKTIKTVAGNGTPRLEVALTDSKLPRGDHWYYWEIAQQGSSRHYSGNTTVAQGHLAWSSPHWVHVP